MDYSLRTDHHHLFPHLDRHHHDINFFSSHRAMNGSNNNPSALQYAKGINTILITRRLVSTKSNAGGKEAVSGATPYNFDQKGNKKD